MQQSESNWQSLPLQATYLKNPDLVSRETEKGDSWCLQAVAVTTEMRMLEQTR